MKVRTEFPKSIVEHEDMGIVMSDGCRLSARVWLPDDASANPVPAVLEYIPYRKRDGTLPRDEMMHPYVAGHGYACVRVDMRGNGDSEGVMTDEYTIQELADACEVIEWLAEQDWCNGLGRDDGQVLGRVQLPADGVPATPGVEGGGVGLCDGRPV